MLEQRDLEEKFDYIVFYDEGHNKFTVVCNQRFVGFVWPFRTIHKKFNSRRLKKMLSGFYEMRGIIIFRRISYKEAVEKLNKAYYPLSISYWYGVNMRRV